MVDASSEASTSYTAFRLAEKHFKNKAQVGRLPSLRNLPSCSKQVLDLSRPERQGDDEVWQAGWWGPDDQMVYHRSGRKGKGVDRGERPGSAGSLETFKRIELGDGRVGYVVAEGCILIPQYLDDVAQLDLTERALAQYTLPPNPLSISTHYELPPDLFEWYINDSEDLIYPLVSATSRDDDKESGKDSEHTPDGMSSEEVTVAQEESRRMRAGGDRNGRKTVDTPAGHVIGYEEILAKNKEWKKDPPSDKVKPKTAKELMRDVRWANLGWVYQWSIKSYDFRPDTPITFPPELADLCSEVVSSIPWDSVYEGLESPPEGYGNWKDDYRPDTGIVNFYQVNDTLMGHVDRADLGHAGIFLLGTSSRQDPPQPIVLRSGDVFVMSGKGRQNYHGIPRVMQGTLPRHFEPHEDDSRVRAGMKRWIKTARVNINARQVFPPGFDRAQSRS